MGWDPREGTVAAVIAGRPDTVLFVGTTIVRIAKMAKLIVFGEEARRGLERGMNALADTVR